MPHQPAALPAPIFCACGCDRPGVSRINRGPIAHRGSRRSVYDHCTVARAGRKSAVLLLIGGFGMYADSRAATVENAHGAMRTGQHVRLTIVCVTTTREPAPTIAMRMRFSIPAPSTGWVNSAERASAAAIATGSASGAYDPGI